MTPILRNGRCSSVLIVALVVACALALLTTGVEGQPPMRLFGTGTDGKAVPITATSAGLLNVSLNGGTPSGLDGIGLDAGAYINWGATAGTGGYGIRDNAGALEFKNSGGSWAELYISGAGVARGPLTVPGPLTLTCGTVSGTATTSCLSATQTWNGTGAIVGWDYAITDAASDAASLAFRIRGGAAGTTTLLSVGRTGSVVTGGSITAGTNVVVDSTGGVFRFSTRGYQIASGDGSWAFNNNAGTGFTALNLGPTTGNSANGTLSVSKATSTLTCNSGTGACTATNLIPAGSLVLGVDLRVSTALSGTSLTMFGVGDGTDADRWGAAIAIALNTTTGIANFTIASPVYYAAATSVVLTADAGQFDAGVVKITVYYIALTPIAAA